MKTKEQIIEKLLNKNIDKLKNFSFIINNDYPFFKNKDYELIEGNPKYFKHDEYGRASGGIAIISRYTLSIRTEKHLKYPDPNGWTKEIGKSGIFQRCHCIAYRLSAKKNEKDNMFIGTIDLNKTIMNEVENLLEQYIRKNEKRYIRIIYRVTPIYKEKNQIPTGILMEAKSLDSDYTLCRFCYNIKKNVKFKYSDGTIIYDDGIIRKEIRKINEIYNKNRQIRNKNIDFVLNSNTKKYHTEKCSALNNVDPKYIKDITTKEQVLIEEGYLACKICQSKNNAK